MEIKEDKFDQVVNHLTETLNRQEAKLQSFIDSNTKLFHLLASGEDFYEEGESGVNG